MERLFSAMHKKEYRTVSNKVFMPLSSNLEIALSFHLLFIEAMFNITK